MTARYTICALILVLALLALNPLYLRLMAGIHYLRADNCQRESFYGLANEFLKKAAAYQPEDYEIARESGGSYYRLSGLRREAREKWPLVLRSRELYQAANHLNPLDADTLYGLARAEYTLERLHKVLHPGRNNNPYRPLPWFKEALRLSPNNIPFNYALARYYYNHGSKDEMLTVLRALARTYPSAYHHMKKEGFWFPQIKEAVRQGLEQAVKEEISPREAHKALSSLLAGEKKWEESISHYTSALRYRSFTNRAGDLTHLGLLHLKNEEPEKAEKNFINALNKSNARETVFKTIHNIYKREGRIQDFSRFYGEVNRRYITTINMNILLARSLMDVKNYDEARDVLMNVNRREPTAEAYYLIALIAEIEKDWDSMELLIQKATVLDPDNGPYHLIFSRVLKRLKKLERAETEAGHALRLRKKPSPWTFNHRASIRWGMKDYKGAAKDWRLAISLKPDHAPFYARAAEAYSRLAYRSMAAEYYGKALGLDPENKRYKKRYSELMADRE
ncbi:tetratricopeptide repeat protein [Thermodesulfobacteriota bacterium]